MQYANQMVSKSEQLLTRFRPTHFAKLRHMAVFASVVDMGSFTGAGKRLGVAKSAISRYVTELEEHVGTQLLRRTTRKLSLTEAGEEFYKSCARLVEASIDAIDCVEEDAALSGTLVIASTVAYGHYVLIKAVDCFMRQHPEVKVSLRLSDRMVDLVDNSIDLGIRIGSRGQSPSYISRKISEFRYKLFASDDLLQKHGSPKEPKDATKLPWVLSQYGGTPNSWTFEKRGRSQTIEVRSKLAISEIGARIEAAIAGQGLVGVPDYMSERAHSKLTQVLPDYQIEPLIPVYAVYPNANFVSPKLRAFLNHLTEI